MIFDDVNSESLHRIAVAAEKIADTSVYLAMVATAVALRWVLL